MTLNSSGPISLGGATAGQSINLELGFDPNFENSLNFGPTRALANIPSGTISLSDFYGRPFPINISYIVVGGGGGAAQGGGGAGGFVSGTMTLTSGNVYSVTVGGGGSGTNGDNSPGGNFGSNSSLTGATTAIGGSGGGWNNNDGRGGGASGGGGGCNGGGQTFGGSGTQGNAGGGNGTAIINGTSTVDIATANGNISMAVAGSNVMLISDTQIETTVAVVAPAIYATEAIVYNSNQITGEQTLPANYNGLSAGDITITNSGNVNLSTSNWVIV